MADEEKRSDTRMSKMDIAKSVAGAAVIAYLMFDWRSLVEHMEESPWQWVLLFVVGTWAFWASGVNKYGRVTLLELGQICLLVAGLLLVFAILTEGYGCSRPMSNVDGDCRPAGPGIYNDC